MSEEGESVVGTISFVSRWIQIPKCLHDDIGTASLIQRAVAYERRTIQHQQPAYLPPYPPKPKTRRVQWVAQGERVDHPETDPKV